jgi:hypothetical protein
MYNTGIVSIIDAKRVGIIPQKFIFIGRKFFLLLYLMLPTFTLLYTTDNLFSPVSIISIKSVAKKVTTNNKYISDILYIPLTKLIYTSYKFFNDFERIFVIISIETPLDIPNLLIRCEHQTKITVPELNVKRFKNINVYLLIKTMYWP